MSMSSVQVADVMDISKIMSVETVSAHDVYSCINAKHVSEQAFQSELDNLMRVRGFEGMPTGFLIVWSREDDAKAMISIIMDQARHAEWKDKRLSDNRGRTRQLFLLDGGTMLNSENGCVQAATIHFASKASCPFILDGHGTKHQTAVNLSYNWDVVVMVRSVDSGDITIFSHALTLAGRAVRVPAAEFTALTVERTVSQSTMPFTDDDEKSSATEVSLPRSEADILRGIVREEMADIQKAIQQVVHAKLGNDKTTCQAVADEGGKATKGLQWCTLAFIVLLACRGVSRY